VQKRILEGLTMLMIMAAIVLMAALVSAHAQTTNSVVVDVPFDFTVGSRALKAGEYSARTFTTSGDTIVINSKDRSDVAFRLSRSIQASDPQHGKLVFHRYGERYFLSEVWTIGSRIGRQLLKSAEERALENQLAATSSKNDVAKNTYETVEIGAMVR
jgi:hypothetical protein